MKTYRFADSKKHEPDSPESISLRKSFAERYPDIASGEVFRAGQTAAYEGWTIDACPYVESSPKYAEWRRGYLA